MTAEATYHFLKPSLEQLSQEEKDELCRLISGEPEPKTKSEDSSRLKRIAEKKKLLLKTGLFKN